jgi:uncharacterized membrane protein HdeD (DUF308 family)
MTGANEINTTNSEESMKDIILGDVAKNWGWILALGILFVVLGTIGLGMSVFLTIVSVMFFGILILVGGIFQVIDAFKCKGWKGTVWHVLIGLLYVAVGIMLLTRPLAGSLVLTVMLGGSIIAVGILRIIMGFQLRGATGTWGWVVFSGVVTLVLGFMILSKWPGSGLWVIGLFVAIEMIMHGWSYIMVALAVKSTKKMVKQTP